MTNLIREMQSDALNPQVNISYLLRKCIVLAARLGNEELRRWAKLELDGYPDEEDLPKYRIIKTKSFGKFAEFRVDSEGIDYFGDPQSFPIPASKIKNLKEKSFREPISVLSHIVSSQAVSQGLKEGSIVYPWSLDMIKILKNLYSDYYCLEAHSEVSISYVIGLIETVRTRILDFVLEIEKEAPNVEEALPGEKPIAPDKVINIFNMTILGNVGNVATGSSGISQSIHQEVHQGDLESLKRYLLNCGLEVQPSDLQELEAAVTEDEDKGPQGIGDKTKELIGKIAGKTKSMAEGMSISLATEIVTKAVSAYLGLPP